MINMVLRLKYGGNWDLFQRRLQEIELESEAVLVCALNNCGEFALFAFGAGTISLCNGTQ